MLTKTCVLNISSDGGGGDGGDDGVGGDLVPRYQKIT